MKNNLTELVSEECSLGIFLDKFIPKIKFRIRQEIQMRIMDVYALQKLGHSLIENPEEVFNLWIEEGYAKRFGDYWDKEGKTDYYEIRREFGFI